MFGGDPTPAIDALVREEFTEVDGEIREIAPPDRTADLLLAIVHQDVAARARSVAIPTLLIACGHPPERRAAKQRAWQAFADASPLIELHVENEWGHNPLLQDPEASASLITDWLHTHL